MRRGSSSSRGQRRSTSLYFFVEPPGPFANPEDAPRSRCSVNLPLIVLAARTYAQAGTRQAEEGRAPEAMSLRVWLRQSQQARLESGGLIACSMSSSRRRPKANRGNRWLEQSRKPSSKTPFAPSFFLHQRRVRMIVGAAALLLFGAPSIMLVDAYIVILYVTLQLIRRVVTMRCHEGSMM
ncbi:hypothetical protein MRX96_037333 [Rhipicephalus microplus]